MLQTGHMSPMGELTPLESLAVQETALRHAMIAEAMLMVEGQPNLTVAYTGALILSRMAWLAHSQAKGTIKPYRALAHAILESGLDEMELLMNDCGGRA